ncbi:MAG: hypothetical protein HKN47_26660 [Pirellulaceae bacterium]|nr:hypothetical protein [Pirellulaceae bacterium]
MRPVHYQIRCSIPQRFGKRPWASLANRSGTKCLAIVSLCVAATLPAQMPAIELRAVFPMGGKTNTESELRVASGSWIDETDRLLFSHPDITAQLITDEPLPLSEQRRSRFGHFQVHVGKDVPPGRYDVRAIGRHGVSNPRSFLVHQLGSDQVVTPSHVQTAATPVAINSLTHAKATVADVDYYKLHGDDGQTIRIDLLAVQLDSRMIGQMVLIDASGQRVLSASGSDEIDPHLILPVHKSQDYTLAIHDLIFRGGDEYGYQIAVRDVDRDVDLVHPNPADGTFVRLIGDYRGLVQDSAEIEETTDAKPIDVPIQFTAEFDRRIELDVYEFAANEGDQYVIDLLSERLGQPSDARNIIQQLTLDPPRDPIWKPISNSDDAQSIGDGVIRLNTNDPIMMFKAPKSTRYRLAIRDVDTGDAFGVKQRYWLDIRKPNPRFDLLVYPTYPSRDDKPVQPRGSRLDRGGAEALRVFAVRKDGWRGSIELSVLGLPEGVTCAPATMHADRDQVQLVVSASESAKHAIANLQVIGKGMIDGKETTVTAACATVQWGRGGERDFIRTRQSDDLVVAVSERDIAPVTVQVGENVGRTLKKGGELKLPVKLVRRDGGKAECVVRPRDLPPNVTAGEVKIGKDQTDGEMVLKANPKAVTGSYSLWTQTETKIKTKPNPQALQRALADREALQKLRDDPANAPKLDEIVAAIKTADARVESAKADAAERELTVLIPSPHLTIQVVD